VPVGGGSSSGVIPSEACADVLRSAFPRAEVRIESGRFGDRARAGPFELESLQYLYLSPSAEGRVELLLYPADTLTQARAFWSDPRVVEAVLALQDTGWRVNPNFHLGFMERGLTWTETRTSVATYVRYWRAAELATLEREDWSQFLNDLVAAGIASDADREQFHEDFTRTRRRTATPRPGLRLAYGWASTRFDRPSFPRKSTNGPRKRFRF
jgi:hypothetical protein